MGVRPKLEIKVSPNSQLIGKTIAELEERFKVKIFRCIYTDQTDANWLLAKNPEKEFVIPAQAYLTFQGELQDCLKLSKLASE